MTSLEGRQALVIGAGSGVGRATVKTLVAAGARVVAIARGLAALEELRAETAAQIRIASADATDPATAEQLLRRFGPQLVVLAAGVRPHLGALDEQTWETFSEAWNGDTRATFHLTKAALALPLSPGSAVAIVSSGAAIEGSPLSGGYAGAKRMQWLLAEYAQQLSERKNLGIRFLAVVPHQLIEGTAIGTAAADAYGATRGISGTELFRRNWSVPLDAGKVAAAIVGALRGDVAPGIAAIDVTGEGIRPLE